MTLSISRTLMFFWLAVTALPPFAQEHRIRPVQDLVPATRTAIGTAVAVRSPIHGETSGHPPAGPHGSAQA